MKKKESDVGVGTIKLLSDNQEGGIITELGSDEELLFHVQDFGEQVDPLNLEGMMVQYIRQDTDVGPRAKGITVIGERIPPRERPEERPRRRRRPPMQPPGAP
jgi:hypothetical protein